MREVGLNSNMKSPKLKKIFPEILFYRKKPVSIADFVPFLTPTTTPWEKGCIKHCVFYNEDYSIFDNPCLISIEQVLSDLTSVCPGGPNLTNSFNHLNISDQQYRVLILFLELAFTFNSIWKFCGYNYICGKILRILWFWSLPDIGSSLPSNQSTQLALRKHIKDILKYPFATHKWSL